MRRPLAVLALGLMLIGVEVATGAVTLGASRLWLGFIAAINGDEFLLPRLRYLAGVALIVVGVGMFALLLYAGVVRGRVVEDGEHCPKCGGHARRVRRHVRHRILSRILDMNVTRRRCDRCGWSGLSA